MTDVAQLGLAVSSEQVNAATAALNKLTAASAAAEKGADKLASSGQKSETVMRAIDAAAKRAGISTAEMEKRVDANSAAHIKMAAAQQTAVKAMVDLSTQGKRVANDNVDLAGKTDRTTGSFDRLANTLTRRVLFAFIAKEVRDLAGHVWNLNAAMAATADSAQLSGISGQNFQGLQTAAAFKGVDDKTFNAAMVAFNQQVDLAKHGLGDLKTLFSANGKTVSDTATNFGIVADMVKKAGSEAQKFSILQQAGLPASAAFVKLMEQGGAAIKAQADAAAKFTDKQLDDAKRLDEAWAITWRNFTTNATTALVTAMGKLKDFGEEGDRVAKRFGNSSFWKKFVPEGSKPEDFGLESITGGDLANSRVRSGFDALSNQPTNTALQRALQQRANPANTTFDPSIAKQQIALEQQRLAILGPLATAEDVVRQKQLEINSASLNNVNISKEQAAGLKLIALAQFEMYRVNQQAAIGVFDLAKAQKAANDNLQALVAQRLLDPANAEQWAAAVTNSAKAVEQLAQSAKIAGAPLEGLQRLANEAGSVRTQLDQFATTSFNAVTPALRDMLLGTTSLSDGFKNLGTTIVNALTDAIIKITIIKPLIDALQSSLGSSSLGSLLGIGGTGTVANGGIVLGGAGGPGMFAAAAGGTFGPGWGVVGEMGPELIKVHGGAVTVIPNHISRPYLPGFAAGGMLNASGNVSRLPFGQDNAPQVNVNVYGGGDDTTVSRKQNGNGDIDIDVMIGSAAARQMGNPGSALRRVTDQRGVLGRR